LSDEFIITAKNSGILEKAIKGDKKAINDLQKAAAKDLVNEKDLKKASELFGKNSDLAEILGEDYNDLADIIADTDL
jgi:hypothetical protein